MVPVIENGTMTIVYTHLNNLQYFIRLIYREEDIRCSHTHMQYGKKAIVLNLPLAYPVFIYFF